MLIPCALNLCPMLLDETHDPVLHLGIEAVRIREGDPRIQPELGIADAALGDMDVYRLARIAFARVEMELESALPEHRRHRYATEISGASSAFMPMTL